MIATVPQAPLDIDYMNPVNWDCDLNRGLQGWWIVLPNMRGGLKWIDIARRNDGTLTNMDPATDWDPSSHPGGFGSLDFDGTDDEIVRSTFSELDGVSQFSAVAWVRQVSGTDRQSLFSIYTGAGAAEDTVFLARKANLSTDLEVFIPDTAFKSRTVSSFFSSEWLHLAITFNSGTLSIYKNGVAQSHSGDTLPSTTNSPAGDLHIGNYVNNFWEGLISKARTYNRALTASEVQDLYLDSLDSYPATLNRITIPAVRAPVAAAAEQPAIFMGAAF